MNRMARQMDQANVETDGRWIVVDAVFAEILMDEDAKLVNRDYGGDGEVRNGKMPGTNPGLSVSTNPTTFHTWVLGWDSGFRWIRSQLSV
jgi:hypothetical protein